LEELFREEEVSLTDIKETEETDEVDFYNLQVTH